MLRVVVVMRVESAEPEVGADGNTGAERQHGELGVPAQSAPEGDIVSPLKLLGLLQVIRGHCVCKCSQSADAVEGRREVLPMERIAGHEVAGALEPFRTVLSTPSEFPP